MRCFGNQLNIFHQGALCGSQSRLVEIALHDSFYALIGGSLNTQEVSMAVQSIRAVVQVRNVTSNHLLVIAGEMAFGKMNGVGKLDDLAEKVRPSAKTLQNAGNLLPSRAAAPGIVGGSGFAGSFCIFDDFDLCGLVRTAFS